MTTTEVGKAPFTELQALTTHPLLERHLQAALTGDLTPEQTQGAIGIAEHVQRRAAEMTAKRARALLEGSGAATQDSERRT